MRKIHSFMLGVVAATLLPVGAQYMASVAFDTDAAEVAGDIEVRGRMLVDGAQGAPEGGMFNSAIIAAPVDPSMIGIVATSGTGQAVFGSSPDGTAINGISTNRKGVHGSTEHGIGTEGFSYGQDGIGVLAVNSMGGTALRVEGAMEKPIHQNNRITLYDDAGSAIGSWRFSFE